MVIFRSFLLCFQLGLATSIISFDSKQTNFDSSNQNIHSQINHSLKRVTSRGVSTFKTRIKHFVLSFYKNVNYFFGSSLKRSLKSYVYSATKTKSHKALKTCEGFSMKHHIFLFVVLYTFCVQCSIHRFH